HDALPQRVVAIAGEDAAVAADAADAPLRPVAQLHPAVPCRQAGTVRRPGGIDPAGAAGGIAMTDRITRGSPGEVFETRFLARRMALVDQQPAAPVPGDAPAVRCRVDALASAVAPAVAAPARVLGAPRPGEHRETAVGTEQPALLDAAGEPEGDDAAGVIARPVHQHPLRAAGWRPVERERPALGVVLVPQQAAVRKAPGAQAPLLVVHEELPEPAPEETMLEPLQATGGIVVGPTRLHGMVDGERMPAAPADPAGDPLLAARSHDLQRPSGGIALEAPAGAVLPGDADEPVERIVLVADGSGPRVFAAHQATEVVVALASDAAGRIDAHALAMRRQDEAGRRHARIEHRGEPGHVGALERARADVREPGHDAFGGMGKRRA